jgi:hypothetical protein
MAAAASFHDRWLAPGRGKPRPDEQMCPEKCKTQTLLRSHLPGEPNASKHMRMGPVFQWGSGVPFPRLWCALHSMPPTPPPLPNNGQPDGRANPRPNARCAPEGLPRSMRHHLAQGLAGTPTREESPHELYASEQQ